MLAFVAKIIRVQNNIDYWENTEKDERPENINGEKTLSSIINEQLTQLETINKDALDSFKSLIDKKEFQNFKGSYDSYNKAISDVLSLIKAKVAEIDSKAYITDMQINTGATEKTTLEAALEWYKTEIYVGMYTIPEDDENNNRYCIYWHRYVPGYIEPDSDYDFAGPEWERIIPEETPVQMSSAI